MSRTTPPRGIGKTSGSAHLRIGPAVIKSPSEPRNVCCSSRRPLPCQSGRGFNRFTGRPALPCRVAVLGGGAVGDAEI